MRYYVAILLDHISMFIFIVKIIIIGFNRFIIVNFPFRAKSW
jgi:hypothetical protein